MILLMSAQGFPQASKAAAESVPMWSAARESLLGWRAGKLCLAPGCISGTLC